MMSAASHSRSMRPASGGIGTNSGVIPNRSAERTRNSAFDVLELVSAPILRTSATGFFVNTATDATAPFETIPMPGTSAYSAPRQNSMDGIIPTSIVFACR